MSRNSVDASVWIAPWRRKRATPRDDLTLPWDVMEDPAPDYLVWVTRIVTRWSGEDTSERREVVVRRFQTWVMEPATDDERAMRGEAFLSAWALASPSTIERYRMLDSFLALTRDVTEAEWREVARRYREGG